MENEAMSVEGIRSIIRRHTGANPRETGPIPHAEVEEMITSAKEGGVITSGERAELLSAVAMFGDTVPGRPSLLSAEDEAELKATALLGIETLEKFLKLTRAAQETFIYRCVVIGSAEYVGFQQVYVNSDDLPEKVANYIEGMLQHIQEDLGNDFESASLGSYGVTSVVKNEDIYGYIVGSSFPKRNSQLYADCSSIVGAGLRFYRLLWKQIEEPEPDPD
jgi:hypothetical protein